jgi:hypothetical protein
MGGITIGRSLRRGGALLSAGAGVGIMLMWSPTLALAAGNPHFDGILSAAVPTGFLISPQAYDVSHGPATISFSTQVKNLTDKTQPVALKFSVEHILTVNGVDVADGQPGQPGITFNGPQGTTQALMPGTQAFTAVWEADQQQTLTRTYSLATCGYFQIDIWKGDHPADARHRDTLASGFIRALGCAQAATPTPTPSASSSGGGGAVLAASTGGLSTPGTGASMLSPGLLLGIALFILGGGLLMTATRNRRMDI